jgi:hypothetical protein
VVVRRGPGAGGSCPVSVGARMIGGSRVGRARSGTGDEARVGEGKRAGFGGLATTTACGYAVAFRGTGAVRDECGARPVSRRLRDLGGRHRRERLRPVLGAPRRRRADHGARQPLCPGRRPGRGGIGTVGARTARVRQPNFAYGSACRERRVCCT